MRFIQYVVVFPFVGVSLSQCEVIRLFTFLKNVIIMLYLCWFDSYPILSRNNSRLGYFVFYCFELYFLFFRLLPSSLSITLLRCCFSICTAWKVSLDIIAGIVILQPDSMTRTFHYPTPAHCPYTFHYWALRQLIF